MTALTLRYNNPGAVEFAPWMQKYGATVGPNGRYAQFPSVDAGYGAMGQVLDTYQNKHGLNTVGGIINRWAPPSVDNNSTSQYIASVAGKIGIGPNDPIPPEKRQALMHAMAGYEAGGAVLAPGGQPPPMALGGPAAQSQQQAGTMPTQGLLDGQPQGGWLDTFGRYAQQAGDRINAGVMSPLGQFGAGMAAAGSSGRGLAGGAASGAQAVQQGNFDRRKLAGMDNELADRQRVIDFVKGGGADDMLKGLPDGLRQQVQAGLQGLPPAQQVQMLQSLITGPMALNNDVAKIRAENQAKIDAFRAYRAGRQPAAAAGAPSVGSVMDGHRFKGGNPADPSSWEAVQ